MNQLSDDTSHPLEKEKLKKDGWFVQTVPLKVVQAFIQQHHYAAGGSNTATYRHGLFKKGHDECLGVAWWIPPTKSAALATFPEDWQSVLSLSRLALHPSVPKNGASYLLGQSRKLIDKARWRCFVTYADEWQGHEGGIYRADNWKYVGRTKPERTYIKNGVMTARKAGPKTRTHAEMLALGAELIGSFSKHKFVRIN